MDLPGSQSTGSSEPLLRSESPAVQLAIERCQMYASVARPVVLVGPVGAGKSTLARVIHDASGRSGSFVAMTGGELSPNLYRDALFGHVAGSFSGATRESKGAFSRAAHGTILFDDLQYLERSVQVSLLHVMSSRKYLPIGSSREERVTARELFASTESLKALEDAGTLLPDLASRIGELIVHVPPLRERAGDIPILARTMVEAIRREHGVTTDVDFTAEAMDLLVEYEWPKNLRELKAVVERAVIHAGLYTPQIMIAADHLPDRLLDGSVYSDATSRPRLSRALVALVLRETQGNQSEAARQLGVHRNTIAKYMS